MSRNYQRKRPLNERRQSTSYPVFVREQEEVNLSRRLSSSINVQRRLSTVSQIYLPHGNEYHPQEHVPPTGPESQQGFVLTTFEDELNEERRLSIISGVFHSIDESLSNKIEKKSSNILFYIEPIICGLILFPILVLYWECGWNLVLILLNGLNDFNSTLHLDEMTEADFDSYSWHSLIFPYLIVQLLLCCYYLFQEFIYKFLNKQNYFLQIILLKFHIFGLGTIYIIQWEMLWTIWDQFTPNEWYFEITVSITSLFALIVFIGHLSDLVCSPFLFSYDSIEYSIHFGCPLLTRNMKEWKINLINYILYEIILSNLSIMTWRGFYHYLDNYLYPDNLDISSGICLLIGYLLYFPLMYFQRYLEELNLKYEFWTFISINFPQFYRNIRHFLAFISCVFLWRGYWLLYDTYIDIFNDYYQTYLLLYLLTFIFLSFIQTSSSINGPLSNIQDENDFFPLYPHCYISIIQRKFSQFKFFRNKHQEEQNTTL